MKTMTIAAISISIFLFSCGEIPKETVPTTDTTTFASDSASAVANTVVKSDSAIVKKDSTAKADTIKHK